VEHNVYSCLDLLFVGKINLEADDITVLDFTLRKGALSLHELNHARFDFLNQVLHHGTTNVPSE
jgi:hypothetical protein